MTPHESDAVSPLLRLEDVYKSYGGVHALRGVSLDVWPGEVHALLGENGAGKSTLMKILSGAHRMDAGRIVIDGREVDLQGPRHAQELGVAIIYQELTLVPTLSAAENIFLGREPRRVAGIVEIRPWVMSWGDQVEVLEPPELRDVVATAARGMADRYG